MAALEPRVEGHLQARFTKLTMVALTFTIFNTWIVLAGSVSLILPSGGAVSFLYGFIFCVLCNLALAASLGEMAAVWPTAGGQYHFVYALCTDTWKRPMSFWVGWITIVGWLTSVTTEGFFAAQFIGAAAVLATGGTYVIEAWNTYLIYLVVVLFTIGANIWGNNILGRWNDAALYWSLFGVVVISVVMLATSPKNDAAFVFTEFQNQTGWADGVAWMLGLLQSAMSLTGLDAALHMTEEMAHPSKDAPSAMIWSIAVGGVTGVSFILVLLFCLTDPATILSTPTNQPISELFLQTTGSRAAAAILSLILAVCFVNGTSGCVTSSGRLVWAMARDKGIVRSDYFAHISPSLNVPVRAIMLTGIFNVLFGMLYLGPSVAFSAFSAACTIFLNASYAIPIIILLLRGRGLLEVHQSAQRAREGRRYFALGRWTGLVINWVSAVFVVVTSVFFCFPTVLPVSGSVMNYVSAVIAIFVFLVGTYWMIWGKQFEGPKLDNTIGHIADDVDSTSTLQPELASSDYEKEVVVATTAIALA